ncbi:DUF411 domain-containing protein [Variovorax saccharolyticus]|uniref:DUF411 domain-containing protein n=1 Tax=Variovorax saccharolyticus TaxID=3053516 RepID=UPI002578FD2B|nr:DUF411 domain-containing protein [Variovorax sp. J22R187]MDM0021229.1 DUF411 domain-containing protein [Variovorax sp. J22R187]
MKRRTLLGMLASLPLVQSLPAHAATQVQVYKNPSCGCCGAWVDHLKAAGFAVRVTETDDAGSVRKRLGMPERLASCHTAVVEGYALEGHVPAADVKRLLALKPPAVGLAVPGMPVGSPGMEYGDRKDPYEVILVDRKGRDTVFARYPQPPAGDRKRL